MSTQMPGPTGRFSGVFHPIQSPALDAKALAARAERYRKLAQMLYAPDIIAVVMSCARELEQQAAACR